MQKISPLKSSIEAFNKFRASRANKAGKTSETQNNSAVQTNPFGITFKGTVIQMDVFEKADKVADTAKTSIQEKLKNTGKLLASAWVGTMNKFSSLKTNAIAFGNKIKESAIATGKKIQEIGNTEIKFSNPFKYNVSNLANKSVSDLRDMLSSELQGVS